MKPNAVLKSYFLLSPKVYVILFSTVINRIGGFVGPFVTLLLANQMGFSSAFVGVAVAVNASASIVGSLIGGRIVDYYGSRKTRIVFHGLHGLMYGIAAFYQEPVAILILLFLASFFMGVQAPTGSTLIMAHAKPEERKSAFSLNYIAINIGFSIGPLIANYLFTRSLTWLFLGDAVSSMISIAIIAWFVPKDTLHQTVKTERVEKDQSTLSVLIKQPQVMAIVLTIALYFIAFSQFSFGMPLTVTAVIGAQGTGLYAKLMLINGLMCMFLTPVISMLVHPLKVSWIIALNGLLYAVGFGLYAFVSLPIWFIVATVIWTIGEILGATTFDVYIAETAPVTHIGRVSALAPLARRFGSVFGPMIAGAVLQVFNFKVMWLVIVALSSLGILVTFWSDKQKKKKEASYTNSNSEISA